MEQDAITSLVEPVKSFWETLSEKACINILTVKVTEAREKAAREARLQHKDRGELLKSSQSYLEHLIKQQETLKLQTFKNIAETPSDS